MHFVILIVLVVAVYGRDLSDTGYYPANPHGRNEREPVRLPPSEDPKRRYEENDPNRGNHENYRPADSNYNRRIDSPEYDRELLNNDRNGRRHRFPGTDRHTHDIIREMNINLAFERQGPKKHREENFNLPKQSFSINDEYSKRVDVINQDSNRSYNKNAPSQRDNGDMVFRNDDENNYDKRQPPVSPNNDSYSNGENNVGIMSFLNNLNINNTNNNINSDKQIKTQPDDRNNMKTNVNSNSVNNTNQELPKTTVADNVTPKSFRDDPVVKSDTASEDKWIWGDDSKTDSETTTEVTLATLDDRAAFEGGKCATGMARVQGKCVPTE